MSKWIVGEPGGPSGPFYSVVSQTGEAIALQVVSQERAEQIAKLGAILDMDFDTVTSAGRKLKHILNRDNADSLIDPGAEDYIVRAVIEALLK